MVLSVCTSTIVITLVYCRIVKKLSIVASIVRATFMVVLMVEKLFPTRTSLDNILQSSPEYHQRKALQGLSERELAVIRWFQLFNGKLEPRPEIDDYFIDKTKPKADVISDLGIIQENAPDSPHILIAGPFNRPTQQINFRSKEHDNDAVKSLFFDFSKPNQNKVCLLHFHGGAYIIGSSLACHVHERFCAENGYSLLGVQYSLYPQSQIEDAIEEGYRAYRWLIEEKKMDEIYFMGESAGGNLALLVLDRIAREDPDSKIVKGALLLCPWLDLTMKSPPMNDIEHQDRCIPNRMIRLWKVNGVPCGLDQAERALNFSPCYWDKERLDKLKSVLPKGLFISYSLQERFSYEISLFIKNLKASDVNVTKHTENIPFHAFHMVSDLLPDLYARACTGMKNFIEG